MASYTDAFGFTPEQFLQLTLPQLKMFAEYAEKRDAEMEKKSKSPRSSNSGSTTASTGSSFESLVNMFGTKETKAKLLNNG
jgi:hypothetical protein